MDIPNVVINAGLQAHTSDIQFPIDRAKTSVTYLRQWNYPGGRQKSTDKCDLAIGYMMTCAGLTNGTL